MTPHFSDEVRRRAPSVVAILEAPGVRIASTKTETRRFARSVIADLAVAVAGIRGSAGLTYCAGDLWEPGCGTCGNCGAAMDPAARRRWFCKGSRCAKNWRVNHQWGRAKDLILKRAHGRCQRCHKLTKEVGPLEVNHIEPRAGETLGITSCANHQSNLEALCHGCHLEATAEQRKAGKI